ncbi:hypothetical protein ABE28_003295 [Peribacillus muralis]|uniref:Uncharacterized protein n=1 Tax=Peribacillus muralis TaxID=264697 RepID=A0A1B3XJG3_9BACI|nr:hypothetical protein [Peribacillus muralis]AOH53365.1 hypothetical protein ABE28_003295 [Peribacillus muralis]
MNINIKVYLQSNNTKFLKSGSFPVSNSDFKKDPDWAAAIAAYEWIREIKMSFSISEDFRIDQVIYNGENDITELVRTVRSI